GVPGGGAAAARPVPRGDRGPGPGGLPPPRRGPSVRGAGTAPCLRRPADRGPRGSRGVRGTRRGARLGAVPHGRCSAVARRVRRGRGVARRTPAGRSAYGDTALVRGGGDG